MNPCSSNPHCSRANRPSSRRDDIRVDILVSYWILEEKLSVFSTDHEAGWGLLINSLYHAEEIFFYAYFVELFLLTLTLIMSGCGTQPDAARAWTALRCSLSLWASLCAQPPRAQSSSRCCTQDASLPLSLRQQSVVSLLVESWIWCPGNAGLIKQCESRLPTSIFWKFEKDKYWFFFEYLVEFSHETTWSLRS